MRSGIRRFSVLSGFVLLGILAISHPANAKLSACNAQFHAFLAAGGVGDTGPQKRAMYALEKCLSSAKANSPSTPNSSSVLNPFDYAAAQVAAPKIVNPVAGDVLVMGGLSTKTTNTEFFNPSTKKFVKTGFTGGTAGLTPVELAAGGPVLIAGGFDLAAPPVGALATNEQKIYLEANAPTVAQLYNFTAGLLAATSGGSLNAGRAFYTATLISGCVCALDGQVLIAGGFDATGTPLDTAELYNPGTQTFTLLPNPMTDARAMHTATLLSDGTVLIVGGIDRVAEVLFGFGASAVATNSAEIFDPSTQTFAAIPAKNLMPFGAAGHTATLLQNGKVLIAGGFEITPSVLEPLGTSLNQAESYDPGTQAFTATGSLTDDRVLHTATLLPNGTVLVTGGATVSLSWMIDVTTDIASIDFESGSAPRNTAEIYDPNAGTFTCVKGKTKNSECVASMAQTRAGQSATLLTTAPLAGQVLIAGGWSKTAIQATAELYNPTPTKTSPNGSFKATGSMSTPHVLHGALLLQ